ncbi:MAG: hypothetical protein HY905_01655 [Deltaproteobacteria bacterium]|nr:hypothetical protein [Deltaproteobacteria bacterium]
MFVVVAFEDFRRRETHDQYRRKALRSRKVNDSRADGLATNADEEMVKDNDLAEHARRARHELSRRTEEDALSFRAA